MYVSHIVTFYSRSIVLSIHKLFYCCSSSDFAPYNLRHRTHSLELPAHTTHLTDCAFITRMLYKDVY